MTPSTTATPLRLFDDFKRTHPARSDRLHESEFDYLNRSARSRAQIARDLCDRWFAEYSNDAETRHINDLYGRFRDHGLIQHHGAWFELLTHQVLVRLGFDVGVHHRVPGSNHKPDFAASSNGSRIYVEATAAGVRHSLPYPEEDARQKLADLKSPDFHVWIEWTEGTLTSLLTRDKLLQSFKRFLASHDPDEVQCLIDKNGDGARPKCTIRFGEWKLTVALWPVSPALRQPRDNRVSWFSKPGNYTYVPDARKSIADKLNDYRRIDDTLVLAVTVYNLWSSDLVPVAHATVFGNGGIWSPNHKQSKTPAGVLFFSNSRPYDVPAIEACLCVNPSVSPAVLPPALLRLPHCKGPDGSERVEGESVERILGTD